jgi:hypothetical protein
LGLLDEGELEPIITYGYSESAPAFAARHEAVSAALRLDRDPVKDPHRTVLGLSPDSSVIDYRCYRGMNIPERVGDWHRQRRFLRIIRCVGD